MYACHKYMKKSYDYNYQFLTSIVFFILNDFSYVNNNGFRVAFALLMQQAPIGTSFLFGFSSLVRQMSGK